MAPTCIENGEVEEDEDDQDTDENTQNQWSDAKCCQEMKKGCPDQELCKDKCIRLVSNRARFTSSEIGYYYNFKFDKKGLPKGCEIFKGKKDEAWYREKRSIMEGVENTHGCQKQKARDEKGHASLFAKL